MFELAASERLLATFCLGFTLVFHLTFAIAMVSSYYTRKR